MSFGYGHLPAVDLIVSYSNTYDLVEDVSKRLKAIMATGDMGDSGLEPLELTEAAALPACES